MYDERAKRHFPNGPEEWRQARASVSGSRGHRTLDIMGFQVMQDWESPLMRKMAESVTRPGTAILEIGYGLGLCTDFVQAREPRLHVVVEANRDVFDLARRRHQSAIEAGRMHLLDGFWEDMVEGSLIRQGVLNGYDGIIFDTFPLRSSDLRKNHFPFFPAARKLLARGGAFTYYSDEADELSPSHRDALSMGFPGCQILTELIAVRPEVDCEYWNATSILHVVVRDARVT